MRQPTAHRPIARRHVAVLIVLGSVAVAAVIGVTHLFGTYQAALSRVEEGGRLLMLTERLSLLTAQVVRPPAPEGGTAGPPAAVAEHLARALAEVVQANGALVAMEPVAAEGGDLPALAPAPAPGVDGDQRPAVERLLGTYIAAVRTIADAVAAGSPVPAAAVGTVLATEPVLFERLEAAVRAEWEAGQQILEGLRRVVVGSLVLVLVLLVLQGATFTGPVSRRISRHVADAEGTAAELRAVRDRLEADLAACTTEVTEARRRSDHAVRSKSRFFAHAGHDLWEPLAALGLFIGTLERQALGDRGAAAVAGLREVRRVLYWRLDALLTLSRLDAAQEPVRRTAVDLGPLIESLAAELEPEATAKGLRLRVVPTRLVVETDPGLLAKALRHLLVNAVSFTDRGGVLIGCRRVGRAARIEVHDSGPGIPEGRRRRILEAFVQLPDPGRERGEGIGLGLAIVDRIARLLGHDLTIRSRPGRGSLFALSVPVAWPR